MFEEVARYCRSITQLTPLTMVRAHSRTETSTCKSLKIAAEWMRKTQWLHPYWVPQDAMDGIESMRLSIPIQGTESLLAHSRLGLELRACTKAR